MKKIILVTTLLLFSGSLAFAAVSVSIPTTLTKATTGGTLYAAAEGTASDSTPLIAKNSTGVAVGVFCNLNGTGYSLVTQHMSGTKAYGTSFDSTSMFAEDVTTIGTALLAVPTAINTSNFTSWSEL